MSNQANLIIAGIPRCGTTMMWYASQGLEAHSRMPRNYALGDTPVLKTHQRPSHLKIASEARAIFMYGDPLLAVISTRIHRWDSRHFWNCGCSADPATSDIYSSDILGYEAMFDEWVLLRPQKCRTLLLRYETMHDHVATISEFLGREIVLPPRRERSTSLELISDDELRHAEITYARLIGKVSASPNVAVLPGSEDVVDGTFTFGYPPSDRTPAGA